jgi:hypothetical protein
MPFRRWIFVATLVILLAGVGAVPAQAALIIQNQAISLTTAGGLTEVLDFNKFDPTLGTLISMTISFSGLARTQGDFLVNQDNPELPFETTWRRLLDLSISGLPFNLVLPYQVLSGNASCSGVPASLPTSCGGHYDVLQGSADSPAVDNWQIGPGTFAMTLVLTNNSSVLSSSNVTSAIWTPLGDSFIGNMRVTYDYIPSDAPEPGTLALLAAGIGAFAFLKRRN